MHFQRTRERKSRTTAKHIHNYTHEHARHSGHRMASGKVIMAPKTYANPTGQSGRVLRLGKKRTAEGETSQRHELLSR